MKRKILLVEDETHIAEAVTLNLELSGFDVMHAPDGEMGLDLVGRAGADLVVLDVMLPGMDGITVCERMRAAGHRQPILFLTAKGRNEDKVRGLEAGGDDYMTKPFSFDELLARIRGMFRRQEWYARPVGTADRFEFEGREVNFRTWRVTVDGAPRQLTEKEIMLLKLLVERSGEVVTRHEILDRVWGFGSYPSSRTVDNLIVRLRKIIERDSAEPQYIHTVYGAGYRFTPTAAEEER